MFYNITSGHDAQAAARQPVYKPALNGASRPKPLPRPFDPDDLTRRLYLVLAEQKQYAEKKRRARAAVKAERQAKAKAEAAARDPEINVIGGHGFPLRTMGEKSTEDICHVSTRHPKMAKHSRAGSEEPTASASNRNSGHDSLSSYHHIPRVAALQFARTTTVETVTDKSLVHRLSRQAIKFHTQGPNVMAGPTTKISPGEQNKAQRRAQSMRERHYERNQFQHSQTLATTAEVNDKCLSSSPHKHSIQEYLRPRGLDHDDLQEAGRISTGDMLVKVAPAGRESAEMPSLAALESQPTSDHCEVIVNPDEHRVDWTQSDEATSQQKPTTYRLLRKAESRWALRTRLGSFSSKHSKDDKLPSPTEEEEEEEEDEEESPAEPPKAPTKTGGFFARFKR